MVLLGGCHSEVCKIKSGLGFERDAGGFLLGLDDMWEQMEGWQLKSGIHQAGHPRYFGERGAGQMHGWVAQCPLVKVNRMQSTETIEVGQMVRRYCWKAIEGLQEGVIGELQGGVNGHRSRQGLATHDGKERSLQREKSNTCRKDRTNKGLSKGKLNQMSDIVKELFQHSSPSS